jgi:hypothetical protein
VLIIHALGIICRTECEPEMNAKIFGAISLGNTVAAVFALEMDIDESWSVLVGFIVSHFDLLQLLLF